MSYQTTNNIYVIREISTGKLIKFGSKGGWTTIGAAKGAFALHMHYKYRDYLEDGKGLFDSQDQFVIEVIE